MRATEGGVAGFFCRTAVHTHTAAESRLGSRSWQGGDRDKSLIYWVHFLGSRAPFNRHTHTQAHTNTHSATHTPPHLTAQGQRRRQGRREGGGETKGVERERNEVNRERRLVKEERGRQEGD